METKKVLEYLKANLYSHKYAYIDWGVIRRYQSLLNFLLDLLRESEKANSLIRRGIQKSIMEKYGVLEVEAINILNNYHCKDYVRKYQIYQICDEYREMMLSHLCHMDLPKELQKAQIDALIKVFLTREKDREIQKVLECEAGEEQILIEVFLQEQLQAKEK